MKRFFLLILLPFVLFAQEETLPKEQEVQAIDKQIEELQDMKAKYTSSAKRNANKAMRWQFQKENYSDARRAWDLVARDKKIVEEIQVQIDDLEARKRELNAN
ncbi:MAG: hypothetical protein K940chlam2_00443 [Chlamydiae bacterium]|nr:hypothetical protein [Chlamydiota bacterium]